MNSNAAIQKADFSRFARTLFISDIQGHLPLLDRLLTTVGFCPDDALVLIGDLIEKGAHNLETLRSIIQLTHSGNVRCVAGNCETELLARLEPENAEDLRLYMDLRQPNQSLLWDMNTEAGLGDLYKRDILSFQQTIKKQFEPELQFLHTLPVIVESEECICVHAGLEHSELSGLSQKSCVRQTAWFAQDGPRFAKTVIVGHWPVVLYSHGHLNANPRYNAKRNVFAIDGGCMIHRDGQLNCLIRHNRTGSWDYITCDDLPSATVLQPQSASDGFCFLWGDSAVEPLAVSGSFTLCRHRSTGIEAEIPTCLLYPGQDGIHTSNFTTAELALLPGDAVSVFLATEKGYYVKKNGVCGWYRGTLIDRY